MIPKHTYLYNYTIIVSNKSFTGYIYGSFRIIINCDDTVLYLMSDTGTLNRYLTLLLHVIM